MKTTAVRVRYKSAKQQRQLTSSALSTERGRRRLLFLQFYLKLKALYINLNTF